MILTHLQRLWLSTRGDRGWVDVLGTEGEEYYVLMGSGKGGMVKVALPTDEELRNSQFNVAKEQQ